jgi:hypothetical protein
MNSVTLSYKFYALKYPQQMESIDILEFKYNYDEINQSN